MAHHHLLLCDWRLPRDETLYSLRNLNNVQTVVPCFVVAGLDLAILVIDVRDCLDLLRRELHIKVNKWWFVWVTRREDYLEREVPGLGLDGSFEHEEISNGLSRKRYKSYVRSFR